MHNKGHNISNIIIGASFSLFSGLLFTLNRAINDLLDLNFVNTLLIVFIFRSLFFCMVIFYQSSSETTTENSEECEPQSWWIYTVDKGRNIFLMRLFLILQGLFGGLNNLGAFLAVTLMPIGDAHALIFSAPLPTMVLSKLIFGTRIRLYKFLCGISVFIGIVCISKPSYVFGNQESILNDTLVIVEDNAKDTIENKVTYNRTYIYGIAAALLASISRGCQATTINYLHRNKSTKSANLIGLYSGLGGLIIPLIALLFNKEHFIEFNRNIDAIIELGLICIGISSALGTFMLIKSIELIGSVLESFCRTSDIIIAYLIQVILFHEEINLPSFLGSGLIIGAIIMMALEKVVVESVPYNFLRSIL